MPRIRPSMGAFLPALLALRRAATPCGGVPFEAFAPRPPFPQATGTPASGPILPQQLFKLR